MAFLVLSKGVELSKHESQRVKQPHLDQLRLYNEELGAENPMPVEGWYNMSCCQKLCREFVRSQKHVQSPKHLSEGLMRFRLTTGRESTMRNLCDRRNKSSD